MAKLPRVIQKVFGSSGGTSEFGQVGSDAAGSPTTTKDLDTIQSLTQYLQGLYAITANGNEPPRIQDINALYFLMTSQVKYLFQSGVPEWDADEEYYADASVVLYDDGSGDVDLWVAMTGTDISPNQGNIPTATEGTNWRRVSSSLERTITATQEYDIASGANLIVGDQVNGAEIGDITLHTGNVKLPSASHPKKDLTSFDGTEELPIAEWPDITKPSGGTIPGLVSFYRAQKIIAADDGAGGGTEQFPGSASGSIVTLNATTVNDEVLAALAEWRLQHGAHDFVLRWDGTDLPVTDVDPVTREITVTGTPTAGAGNAEFYPHRKAGDTTVAIVHSLRGLGIIAATTSEVFSMLMRRDRMQQITGRYGNERLPYSGTNIEEGALFENDGATPSPLTASANAGALASVAFRFNSANSPNARTSPATDTEGATHGPDVGLHIEVHGGVYVAPST